jgi:phosphopantothenoylcysteine decarboxylase/phosphopantothenate--cysteine ligase
VLNGKKILLGVTGSIAAYKSLEVIRRLTDENAHVTVVMTESACRFVSPLSFEMISGQPVHRDLFKGYFSHISLAKESHVFLVAPATANTINKFACGIADNLLGTLWLAYEGPSVMAPAMNERMYKNSTVQKNIRELAKNGVTFVGPAKGDLACREKGIGRMAEVTDIIEAVKDSLSQKDLQGHRILVTAGPTREALDPVRYISNRSSGKMGYAIAEAAYRRGANVTLISGPTSIKAPRGITFIPVEKTAEMQKAVVDNFQKSTSAIMVAAVCDFTPSIEAKTKIDKQNGYALKLKKTPDILSELGKKKGKRMLVGFAAETDNDIQKAKKKLRGKNLDMLVFNNISREGAGFDIDTNIVSLITGNGKISDLPLMKKEEIAGAILDRIIKFKR